jgi:hypothetical protein
MSTARARRPLFPVILVLAPIGLAIGWWLSGSDEKPDASARVRAIRKIAGKSPPAGAVGAPRSARALGLDAQADISVDSRPPDARRENIIREGLGTIQELKFMHPQVFDGAAKRWGEDPKVKALVAEWKDVEAAWKTQDEATKAAALPRMQAMWAEAMGLLRAEVELSAREADIK